MDALLPLTARLITREPLAPETALFNLVLVDHREYGPSGNNHLPGQFVMLSVPGVGEAPFSICHAPRPGSLELCIRRAGAVTNRLFDIPLTSRIGVRGPFGNGFPMHRLEGMDLLLMAGGLGLAPLRGVLQYVLKRRALYGRVILAYGMGRQSEALFKQDLALWMEDPSLIVRLAVEEPTPQDALLASTGHVGAALEGVEIDPVRTAAAICGPPAMYAPVSALLKARGFFPENIFFTFERRMECGVGHCGHCAIGCRATCVDGPVFSAWEARSLGEPLEV